MKQFEANFKTKIAQANKERNPDDKSIENAPLEVFSTHYSLGPTTAHFTAGDAVFTVDGVSMPLILRRTDAQRYMIIGECYLWAALELDYLNSGSKKGR